MRCRAVICAACCTRLDGVNHCHSCLKSLGRQTAPASPDRGAVVLAGAGLTALAWLVLFGVCWLLQGTLAP